MIERACLRGLVFESAQPCVPGSINLAHAVRAERGAGDIWTRMVAWGQVHGLEIQARRSSARQLILYA